MEADEMEMSKEELQKWIKENVKKNKLISSDVQEKCILLQSQLEWREKQAADLLKLCKSVSTCEAIVKKQYSLLGWEYRDTDSDDDDNITSCGNTSPSSSHANGPTPLSPKLPDSNTLHTNNDKREPVVVLTRLSACQIRSLSSCRPQNRHSEDESSNYSDSDKQWEPQGDSSDSDSSILSDKTGLNKRRKIHHKDQTLAKSKGIPQASTNQYLCASAKSSEEITSTPQEMAKTDAKSNVMKTSTPPAKSDGVSPVSTVKTPSQTSDKVTKTPPSKLLEELKVNMTVLARSRAINWQPGKIVEMVTKEDGRLKYKINFMNKKKSLLSGHHIAFDYMPKVNTLFVGARVVIKYEAEEDRFCPAFLAELPSRRNRMRFLVFIDDHTPVYVGLPSLHLVCKPLADPLDDIPDGTHKSFMQDYLKAWPYPPQTQYRVGVTINVKFHGVMQKCEVQVVDCSLMQVLVLKDKREAWIYRGSTCLEHIINLRESQKKEQKQKNKSTTVAESSKSAR